MNADTSSGAARLVEELARPEILKMKPYVSARSLVAKGGEASGATTFLDANESPFPPCLRLDASVQALNFHEDFNQYPDPVPSKLYQMLSSLYGVSGDNLLVGRGADEAIDLLVRAFCREGRDSIMVAQPTYGVYGIAAATQGCKTIEVPLEVETFQIDPARMLEAAEPTTKLIFVCSPGNPTGNLLDRSRLLELCDQFRDRALVVVDEAYIEYAESGSLCPLSASRDNLLVLRTLSKAWSLAGLRVGCVTGPKPVIDLLHKIRAPYPLPRPVIDIAIRALAPESQTVVGQRSAEIRTLRKWFCAALANKASVRRVYPSDANFVLLEVEEADAWLARCVEQGIVLRGMTDKPGLKDCVRISIGSREQLESVLETLS